MNAEQAWQSVLGQLQMEMPRASFDTWVRDTKPVSYQDGTLTIGVRNAYARDWLESRLASTVSRLLVGIMNASVSVNFIVNGNEAEIVMDEVPHSSGRLESVDPTQAMSGAAYQRSGASGATDDQVLRPTSLNPRYIFETFVVGSGNRLAHAACLAV
ncbi:MAG TPA: DnaA N-terminal domain-containing protein, partial [Anaerolineales bacterium]|nr:DnaA N-terminal domain-containing protein [Anaerolineales bacterium]